MQSVEENNSSADMVELHDLPQNRKFCKYVKEYLKEYCSNSSIHGLQFLIRDVSIFERIWWFCAFTSCICGCAYMINEIYQKWSETPVIVTLATKDAPIYEIPFPAVTVCPETKISSRCLNYTKVMMQKKAGFQVSKTEDTYSEYMSALCESPYYDRWQHTPHHYSGEFFEFLEQCKSVELKFGYCQWLGITVSCADILKPILTDEGLCYSFNMFDTQDIYSDIVVKYKFDKPTQKSSWDLQAGYPSSVGIGGYPRRVFLSGAQHSLFVILLTPKDDVIYSCNILNNQGLKVSLHMPIRIPRPSQTFFNVGLNRITTAAIIPSVMTTSETVRRYHVQKRGCYFPYEQKLRYFRIYSQSNCHLECLTNFTKEECGCVAFFMPRDNSTPVCSILLIPCMHFAEMHYQEKFLRGRINLKGVHRQRKFDCDCQPLCTDLKYNHELSSTEWDLIQQEQNFSKSQRYMELLKSFNASAFRLFFKSSFFLPMERTVLYGTSDFISNFGGILGLFTGFSIFSIAEIIYFLTVRINENIRQYGHWSGRMND